MVLFLILSGSSLALAEPQSGKYKHLNPGESLPWTGWCFDSVALGEIVANKELEDQRCQLRVGIELEKREASYNLQIGQLKARMDYEVNTRQASIDALTNENEKLEKTIINNEKYGWIKPALAGVATGVIITILVGLVSGG